MILTKFVFVPEARGTFRALTNAQELHRDVQRMFGTSRAEESVLYRVVTSQNEICLYVQSKSAPVWDPAHCGHLRMVYSRDFDEVIDSIIERGWAPFNLMCYPSVRKCSSSDTPSNRTRIQDYAGRVDWLRSRFERGGCELMNYSESTQTNRVIRQGTQFDLNCSVVEGSMGITDPDAFREMLKAGVGPEKAYGCGMLMVV